ncbi:MAG TPA: ABC transporter ATP-binding protein, partial [Pyrinomonadaceae bacterium]|nr:ABC transporter ATP-binding protein [Pyrinomonadaceae bacterium]
MPAAIRVEAVSKQYRIYNRPADRLKETITRGRWKAHREFWALKDISFEVEAGTTTGIIGPNGSGKSTLLQIITGTLEPTHGSVWLEGRVAALLELGAGFNPEFTGIENIFMNTALMGLSKSETESLLPEIASFAEIGDFIYQPLKTYSSGMYIRLAFAAAIAVSPQILIIDEALAVGDAVFQHRCTRRIKQMQENGTTILFVSHDPGAIRALCTRAILLNGGRIEADGAPPDVLNRYQKIIMARETAYAALDQSTAEQSAAPEIAEADFSETPSYTFRHGNRDAEIVKVELLDTSRHKVAVVETGEQLFLR